MDHCQHPPAALCITFYYLCTQACWDDTHTQSQSHTHTHTHIAQYRHAEMIAAKRRRMLQWLREANFPAYSRVITKLGLRDVFHKGVSGGLEKSV